MENIYSKFYTGHKNPFGIGTWDSNNKIRRKLNHHIFYRKIHPIQKI